MILFARGFLYFTHPYARTSTSAAKLIVINNVWQSYFTTQYTTNFSHLVPLNQALSQVSRSVDLQAADSWGVWGTPDVLLPDDVYLPPSRGRTCVRVRPCGRGEGPIEPPECCQGYR